MFIRCLSFLLSSPVRFLFLAHRVHSVLCPFVCVRTVPIHKYALSYLDFFFLYLDCSKTGCFSFVSTIHPTWLIVFGSCICDVCRQTMSCVPFVCAYIFFRVQELEARVAAEILGITPKKHTHKHLEQISHEILMSENTEKF